MRIFVTFLIVTMSSVSSCRSRATNSDTKHIYGQTSRDLSAVTPCQWDKSKSVNEDADRYLAKILAYIAEKNGDIFRDKFTANSICVYLKNDPSFNARALFGTNFMTFNSGLLAQLTNDAEVAAIMTHELSHLSMQSAHTGDIPPAVLSHPNWLKIRDDFEAENQRVRDQTSPFQRRLSAFFKEVKTVEHDWNTSLPESLKNELSQLNREQISVMGRSGKDDRIKLAAMMIPFLDWPNSTQSSESDPKPTIDSFASHYNAVMAKLKVASPELFQKWQDNLTEIEKTYVQIEQIKDTLKPFQNRFDQFIADVAGEDAKYNWREQEADEVGYEVLLRAGFAPEYAISSHQRTMQPDDYNDCQSNYVAKRIVPTRGKLRHPSKCWRIYNLLVLEAEYHKKDYAEFFTTAKIATLFPGELDAIKAKLAK